MRQLTIAENYAPNPISSSKVSAMKKGTEPQGVHQYRISSQNRWCKSEKNFSAKNQTAC